MSSVKIQFGPGPDDVTVDGKSNAVKSPPEMAALVAFVNEARARNFTASNRFIASGRPKNANCIRVIRVAKDGTLEAREPIDLHMSFGATGAGNGNDLISEALADYVVDGVPVVPGLLAHSLLDPTLDVLRKISGIEDGKVFFANDGSVAIDAAVRVALSFCVRRDGLTLDGNDPRWNNYRVVVADGAYHGSGGYARSFLQSTRGRENFGPLFTNVDHVPFGDAQALAEQFGRSAGKVAVVVLEPVQGAGGCVAPPDGYLAAVGAMCRSNGAVFIVDEIKSGFGRLGEHFYSSTVGAEPDLICGGKSAGGGIVPFSFVIGKPDIMKGFEESTWGVTLCAAPLQCIALLRFVALLEDGLLGDVRRKSQYLAERFRDLAAKYPAHVLAFDGIGLMRSLETAFPASKVADALFERGVFTTPIMHPDAMDAPPRRVYITPALTITDEQIDAVVHAFDEVLAELAG